jgi:hypothetical protein
MSWTCTNVNTKKYITLTHLCVNVMYSFVHIPDDGNLSLKHVRGSEFVYNM